MNDSQKQLTLDIFRLREYNSKHSPFEKEFEFYELVRQGDTLNVAARITDLGGEGSGRLSDNELSNIRYHFIVTAALVTRFCVEGGLEMETAYTLSDYYINKVDKCIGVAEINALNRTMVIDFAERMKTVASEKVFSKQATLCMEYVFGNLHSKLSLGEIANHLGLSPAYLSRLFHRETGVTLSSYITAKKVQAAENLLKYSEYSSLEIANYLCFSSHSHFIETFRKRTGLTPARYRDRYFRSDWANAEHEK